MKGIIIAVLAVVLLQGVLAASPTPDLYTAPSWVYEMTSGTSGACDGSCNDSDWTMAGNTNDIKLADGKTGTFEQLKKNGNKQFKVIFDTIVDVRGKYSVRVYGKEGVDVRFYSYLTNSTADSSLFVDGTLVKNEWTEIDVSTLINDTFSNTESITLRVVNVDTINVDIAEIWLRRPSVVDDFSIVAQGVTETVIDMRVENTWNIVSVASIAPITNASCTMEKLNNINETSHSDINISLLNVVYDVAGDYSYFKVYWDANSSAGIEEGYNYELECSGYIGNIFINKFSQFIYVNKEGSFFSNIGDIITYLLQLIGLTADTNELISADVVVNSVEIPAGESGFVTSFVTYADGVVNNASCWLSAWYPNSSLFIDEQVMIASGTNGRYLYEVTAPYVFGSYQLRSFCNGTSLMNRTKYASATMDVFDGVKMVSIT